MPTWVRTDESGESASLDVVRVYLQEKDMWLMVLAAKGSNPRFPNNIAIANIKSEIAVAASTYEGKKLYLYDAADAVGTADVVCGGYEYLDDYVVKPKTKLYCTLEPQNVAGDSSTTYEWNPEEQKTEWDGLTWVQFYDKDQRWEKLLLPDNLPDDQKLTCNMLKRSALAKINMKATKEVMQSMRVFHNSGGIPTGAPFAGKDEIYAHHWYTVVIGWDSRVLVMTAGQDLPSPDSSSDAAGWELTASP